MARAEVGAAGRPLPAQQSSGWASAAPASSTTSATSTSSSSPSRSTAPTRRRRCEAATAVAAAMMRICSDHTREGTLWPVDAGLRPEGRSGPLVRTAGQPRGVLPALGQDVGVPGAAQGAPDRGRPRARRPLHGDHRPAGLGRRPAARTSSPTSQAMRRRVVEQHPAGAGRPQLKLGPGGLRDIEFAVQLLQLVHGRSDPTLRLAEHLASPRGAHAAAATSGARTARRWPTPTGSCAPSSTGSSSAIFGVPTCCPTTTSSLRALGRSHRHDGRPGRRR